MPEYVLNIRVKGQDDGGTKVLSGLRSALGGIATVAGGILLADLFYKIAGGIGYLARESLAAAADLQELEVALGGLLAKEIKQQEDYAMQTSSVRASLTKKQREELATLTDDYGVLTARIQEQKQKIYEWTQVWTDEPALKVQTARAELQRMEHDAASMQARINELNAVEGKWVTTTEKVRVGNMQITEALELAGPKAEELLVYLRDLSLVSPYQFEQVADTFRFSMALGATSDQAKEMTGATMNMSAALGLNNEQLKRLEYNLAQAIFAGDLTMVNLRQLKLVGLDLAGILEDELGMSLQEIRDQMKAGKIDSEDLAVAFSRHVDLYYKGAAERMTRTWVGLKNNMKDLLFFLGADLLGPALDVVTGSLADLFDTAREALEQGTMKKIGEAIGDAFSAILEGDISGAFDTVADGLAGIAPDWVVAAISTVGGALDTILDVLSGMKDALLAGDLGGVLNALADGLAGVAPEWVVEAIRAAGSAVGGLWTTISSMFDAALGGDISGVFDALGDSLSSFLPEGVADDISTLGSNIETFVETTMEKLGELDFSLFTEAFKALQEGDIPGTISGLAEGLGSLGEQMGLFSQETATAVSSAVGGIGEALYTTAQNIGEMVVATADTSWQTFMEWWADNGAAVDTQISNIAASISRLTGALSDDEGGIANIDKMTSALSTFITDDMDETLKQLEVIVGVFEAFAGAIDWIREALDNLVASDFVDEMGGLTEKLGPLWDILEKIFTKPMSPSAPMIAATEMVDGVGEQMERIPGIVEQTKADAEEVGWFDAVAGQVIRDLERMGNVIGLEFGEFGKAAKEEFSAGLSRFETDFTNVPNDPMNLYPIIEDEIKNLPNDVTNLVPTLEGVGKTVGDALNDGILSAHESLGSDLTIPVDESTGVVRSAWEILQGDLVGQSIVPDTVDAIVEFFTNLSADLKTPMANVYNTVADKMGDILEFVQGQIPSFEKAGEDLALGIKKGVKNKWAEVMETFKVKIRELVISILQELGIGSPSKVMADIGENMVEGLEQGILDRWPGLESSVLPTVSNLATQIGTRLGRGLIRAAHKIAIDDEKFFGSVLADIGGKLLNLGMAFGNRYTESFLDPLQEQISSIEDAMSDAKREGQMEEYLALEARRNELSAEYEALQERILRLQRQQTDLQFLQQQVQLIELIKEYGLDARQILSGMTLGLEASTEDLVDAISKALQAIIDSTEKTLQLGSPSRLFMGYGKDIMRGMAEGIKSVKVDVPSPAYDKNGGVPARVDQRNVTYNQTMNVQTAARSSEVQRDWGIMVHMAPTFSR